MQRLPHLKDMFFRKGVIDLLSSIFKSRKFVNNVRINANGTHIGRLYRERERSTCI